jgi:hypothetical protein
MCEGIHIWRDEVFDEKLRYIDAGTGTRVIAGYTDKEE